jgi:hypothetical protein
MHPPSPPSAAIKQGKGVAAGLGVAAVGSTAAAERAQARPHGTHAVPSCRPPASRHHHAPSPRLASPACPFAVICVAAWWISG